MQEMQTDQENRSLLTLIPFHQRLLLERRILQSSQGSQQFPMNAHLLQEDQHRQRMVMYLRQRLPQQLPSQPFQDMAFMPPTNLRSDLEADRLRVIRMLVADEQERALKRRYEEFLTAQQSLSGLSVHAGRPQQAVREETVSFKTCASPAPIVSTQASPFVQQAQPPADEKKNVQTSTKKTPRKKDTKWLATLEHLKEYKKENGDCIVPRGYTLNPRLASWVAEQRKQYKLLKDGKQSSITPERIALLNELDFAWNAQEAAWARHISDLQKFCEETGHCHVPLNHSKYPKLGLWVKEQRRHFTLLKQGKPSHMTQERADKLDAIAFCWDTHEATWLERLRELTIFKEKHGNCVVPTSYSLNPKLGTWVHHQRRQFKKFKDGKPCHITKERIKALDELGFVWNPRDKGFSYDTNDDDGSSTTSSDSGSTSVSSVEFHPHKRPRIDI